MNVKKLILETLQKKGKITVRDIVKKTGMEGEKSITAAKKTLLSARRILTNKNLSEDIALDAIKKQTGIFLDMPKNVVDMLIIQGSKKKLIFNNIINDIFIENIKNRNGTKVTFAISIGSKKQLKTLRL